MDIPKYRILIIGKGAREDALGGKCLVDTMYETEIFVAPGNAGTAKYATNVPISSDEIDELIKFAKMENIDLTIVGPEAPLINGIVDAFQKAGLLIFGPTQAAAVLEGSKVFAKKKMEAYGVPTAPFKVYNDYDRAFEYVTAHRESLVIKADGGCGGKGAYVCHTQDEFKTALTELMVDKKFGDAGTTVVIEDFLDGHELSVIGLVDGDGVHMMLTSQDHKRVGYGDTGLMTGGMGVICPVPWVSDKMLKTIQDTIFTPMLDGMKKDGIEYRGCLYAGLMYVDGTFYVLEWNVRFGDPETQAILPLMESDLVPYLVSCASQVPATLPPIEWHDKCAVCIVLCAEPYPDEPDIGHPITGIDTFEAAFKDRATLYHAGTALMDGDVTVTAGGRVISVVSWGKTLTDAQDAAYEASRHVTFIGKFCRNDIGDRPQPTID